MSLVLGGNAEVPALTRRFGVDLSEESERTMKKALLIAFLALSAAAFAKPAHLLYHTGKSIAYPIRHPQKTTHGLWKLVTAVF
jgi:hypothetical protein